MVKENEIMVRADKTNDLFCTAIKKEDGNVEFIRRKGKKEYHVSVNSLLSQAYGKNVIVTVLND